MVWSAPRPPLLPYTPLFRSHTAASRAAAVVLLGQLRRRDLPGGDRPLDRPGPSDRHGDQAAGEPAAGARTRDRKSTRLNSSHVSISYAVFCLKKKSVAETV